MFRVDRAARRRRCDDGCRPHFIDGFPGRRTVTDQADVVEQTEGAEQAASFAALGLSPDIVGALDSLGYEEPTPIQVQAIPLLLEGRDVIGRAATGTGKTAAFALLLVERLDPDRGAVQALILAPTRELAVQVAEAT